jgi:menaquinone-9 beta-reductase
MGEAGMMWDAIVIGAGPAGSVAAREIARRGRKTLLIDKATFPRAKVCGGCLNGRALQTLADLGLGGLPGRLGAVPLDRVRLIAGGRSATVALPAGMGLSREAFDPALIAEAVAAGAEFRPGTAAVLGESEERARVVRLGGEEVRADVVIVATGLNGRAAVQRGSRIGAGGLLPDSGDYENGAITMMAGPGGYVGVVRVDGGRLDVAAAFDAEFIHSCGGLAAAANAILRENGRPPLPAGPWKGTPALTRRPETVAGERWFAVGDAAGYVEPFTGEGMAWAMAGAAALAPLAAQPWQPDFPRRWAACYRATVRRRQFVCRGAAALLRRPALCRAAVRILACYPPLAGPVVRRLNAPVPA